MKRRRFCVGDADGGADGLQLSLVSTRRLGEQAVYIVDSARQMGIGGFYVAGSLSLAGRASFAGSLLSCSCGMFLRAGLLGIRCAGLYGVYCEGGGAGGILAIWFGVLLWAGRERARPTRIGRVSQAVRRCGMAGGGEEGRGICGRFRRRPRRVHHGGATICPCFGGYHQAFHYFYGLG